MPPHHPCPSGRVGDGLLRRAAEPRARPMRDGEVVSIARMAYDAARRLQWRLRDERIEEKRPDTLLILEHEPVMTLGRTTKPAHWRRTDGHVHATGHSGERERARRFRDLSRARTGRGLSGVEAPQFLLRTERIRPPAGRGGHSRVGGMEDHGGARGHAAGIWVRDPARADGAPAKIAFMGVNIARGVTTHGFALNVAVNLEPFRDILPCGISDCRVTSMAVVLNGACEPVVVREQIARHFGDVFGLRWREIPDGAPRPVTRNAVTRPSRR